jgi:hypothetical protein
VGRKKLANHFLPPPLIGQNFIRATGFRTQTEVKTRKGGNLCTSTETLRNMGEGIMVECVCHGCSTSLIMKDMRTRVVDNGR